MKPDEGGERPVRMFDPYFLNLKQREREIANDNVLE